MNLPEQSARSSSPFGKTPILPFGLLCCTYADNKGQDKVRIILQVGITTVLLFSQFGNPVEEFHPIKD